MKGTTDEGVRCEDCGELPEMWSQSVEKDEVLWMLVCKCGQYKKGREVRRSEHSAIVEWENSGYKSVKPAIPAPQS